MNANYEWAQPKPKPENIPDGKTASRCSKCNGNGRYVMAVVNGQPWSATGTTCYACGGKGWIIKRKPIQKVLCLRCGQRIRKDWFEHHTVVVPSGDGFERVECK